jgi:hypothetical protein
VRPTDAYLEFVMLPSYERSAKGLLGIAEQRGIEQTLVEDPTAGATIAGTGGVRKLRLALPGGGKRGGARVIYFYRGAKGRIYLLLAYPKNERESISQAEKNV